MSATAWRAKQSTLPPLQVPRQCPREMVDLIHDCMKQRPEDRPTAKEIFNILKVPPRIANPHSPVCRCQRLSRVQRRSIESSVLRSLLVVPSR